VTGPPGPLPPPPEDFSTRKLPLIETKGPLFRFYGHRRDARHFGRASLWRFDDPRRRYGVCYTATDVHGAFAETFTDALRAGLITEPELRTRGLARMACQRPLVVVDLVASGGLARIRADARLFAGEHGPARRWSAAIYAHPSRPDGILCPARHDPARTVCAVYERAKGALRVEELGSLMDGALLSTLSDLLETYGLGLGPRP
jgi:hypothetical protein